MDTLWAEKYRPQKIDDLVLPERMKSYMKGYVEEGEIPHMLMISPPGLGKTTAARAIANEIGADYKMINSSLQNSIDVLRNEISNFASTVSLQGSDHKKIVILDEADNLSGQFMQALRAFMEEFSSNCRFILTANFRDKIIEPIQSRCTLVDFDFENEEKAQLKKDFYARVSEILEQEGVEYETKPLAVIVKKFFPDFRRTLNELERYASLGKIDSGVINAVKDAKIESLVSHLKENEFTGMRKWVSENQSTDPVAILRKVYDHLYDFVKDSDIPSAVLIINDGQYEMSFVADKEICLVAILTKLMYECEFEE